MCVQSVERYRDGVILYSLGNFAFGSYSPSSQVGAAAELIFEGNALRTVRLHPINVHNFEVEFAPRLLEGEPAQRAAETLFELSLARDTWLERESGIAHARVCTFAADSGGRRTGLCSNGRRPGP